MADYDATKTYAVSGEELHGIAEAIRLKRDITDGIPVADMAMQVGLISGGGGLPTGARVIDITGNGTIDVSDIGDMGAGVRIDDLQNFKQSIMFFWTPTQTMLIQIKEEDKTTFRTGQYAAYFSYNTETKELDVNNATSLISWFSTIGKWLLVPIKINI